LFFSGRPFYIDTFGSFGRAEPEMQNHLALGSAGNRAQHPQKSLFPLERNHGSNADPVSIGRRSPNRDSNSARAAVYAV
jgi:hypothetical protein